ncbi:uncharacterized protein LOC120355564 [Nilaparvata lugens]|uniref:uncharacterized protein LOC120355564 n=1 Tax=Nilaparvata lugens TaxID=108931 RepID=UPI00193D656E|nr:uncharacterized protein LOC120355564 [Nilaparvata lugens]
MYAVIEFGGSEENQTAVVREEWLTPAKKEVFWPPFKVSTQFHKALVEGATPDEKKWTLFPVRRCLYICDDLLKAREKEKLAEKESDIQTDGDELLDGRRKRRKTSKKLFISSDDSSDDSCKRAKKNLSYKNKCQYYPRPPSPPTNQLREDCSSQSLVSTPKSSTATLTPTDSSIEKTVTESGFAVVARKLAKLESEVLSLRQYLEEYLPKIVCNAAGTENSSMIPDSMPTLPCLSHEDVLKLEERISVEGNEQIFVKFLARIGGKKLDHVVRRILERVISNMA